MLFQELLSRILHWGPIFAVNIINCITFSTLHVTSMWLPAFSSWSASICHLLFLFFAGSTLYNFFCAMFIGPGYVPYGWKPENEDECCYLQYCNLCKGYKPPRAHHCRKCKRCIMKMDHHCPWINNCCGHQNQAKFTLFLISAVLGCFQTSILLSIGIYRALHLGWYIQHGRKMNIVYLSAYQLAFTVFSFGLALGVIIAVGGLLYMQLKQILKNETSIENWIVVKALGRNRLESTPFTYPYDLGRWKNLKQVFWDPLGNGTTDWSVVDGCHQYTLTIEQLIQKKEKTARKKRYAIIQDYSGSWFPLSKGIQTCLSPPCSDEPRIALSIGDAVYVTRWRKRWLYGQKLSSTTLNLPDDLMSNLLDNNDIKGWFPRSCAVEFTSTECEFQKFSKKNL